MTRLSRRWYNKFWEKGGWSDAGTQQDLIERRGVT
jgi:hypothetical protein